MIRVQSIESIIVPLQGERCTDQGGIQLFVVSVAVPGEGTEAYALVAANSSVLGPPTAGAIEALLRERDSAALVAVLVGHETGKASVWLPTLTSLAQRTNVAAAAAVVKVSCAWDESDLILVTVNDDEFALYPSYDGQHWTVSDSRP